MQESQILLCVISTLIVQHGHVSLYYIFLFVFSTVSPIFYVLCVSLAFVSSHAMVYTARRAVSIVLKVKDDPNWDHQPPQSQQCFIVSTFAEIADIFGCF